MNQETNLSDEKPPKKPPSLWKWLIFLIIFVCGAVSLFAAIIYLFTSGIEQLGWPSWLQIAAFVIISGIFAWLLKRISDTVSERSQVWFPQEKDES